MSPGKATLHDVAAVVGVSPRTVSRVVNDEGGFSEATRTRVQQAIADLDYQPNLLARSLITQRSDTIGFVVTVMDDPFFPELAQGVQATARDQGLTTLVAATDDDPIVEVEVLNRMLSYAVDGAIVFPAADPASRLAAFADRGLPLVMIDAVVDHPLIASVVSDLADGTRQAVDHLLTTGRRSLAMLGNNAPGRSGRRERSFIDSAPPGSPVIRAEPTIEGGRAAARAAVREHSMIDGIFAYNDLMAMGAITELESMGRQVPIDVAVIGCDDISMAEHLSPALTTIRIDRARLGNEAVELMAALRTRPSGVAATAGTPAEGIDQRHLHRTLPVSLICRDSA